MTQGSPPPNYIEARVPSPQLHRRKGPLPPTTPKQGSPPPNYIEARVPPPYIEGPPNGHPGLILLSLHKVGSINGGKCKVGVGGSATSPRSHGARYLYTVWEGDYEHVEVGRGWAGMERLLERSSRLLLEHIDRIFILHLQL